MAAYKKGTQKLKRGAGLDTGLTPSQWEAQTGNKLISYSTLGSGNLANYGTRSYMPMQNWKEQQAGQGYKPDQDPSLQASQNFQSDIDEIMAGSKGPEMQKTIRNQNTAQPDGQVAGSFNRMMNIGEVGGLGGRMGELEKASMRLAEAASQRTMGQTEQEYGLRGGLMEKEYGLKDISMGKEYGLKGSLLGKEAALKDISMGKEYGLKGVLLEKQVSAEAAGIGTQAKASDRASLESERRRLQSIGFLSQGDREKLYQINRQLGMLG